MSPKELALEFRRALQAQSDLVGLWLRSTWIRKRYPIFCRALGVNRPPPYKDFAEELGRMMPRKRHWRRGETWTEYLIPDPATAVVALTTEKRKRA